MLTQDGQIIKPVSTHSRPKAAGPSERPGCLYTGFQLTAARRRLVKTAIKLIGAPMFQLTAARRRLDKKGGGFMSQFLVSTHSRPKAAGYISRSAASGHIVSTHSRPKAAGSLALLLGCIWATFQLTAARRRLDDKKFVHKWDMVVSTHSRPKAAGHFRFRAHIVIVVSTHSRPKAAGPPVRRV